MSSPAERFAAAQQRARATRAMGALAGELDAFTDRLDFALDDFQRTACEHLSTGVDVLVAAPTGAGKTVVGEYAVHLGLATGRKTFYTTPIKALSNQKYLDLARAHGNEHVGLLTGDVSINADADVVVMTTEVLRNMIYAASPALENLGYVVMDEVHYLADSFRGPVWEEVILLLGETVRLVSLSATVSNAEEFGQWLREVRGATEVVLSEHRPVPLWQHMMVRHEVLDLYTARVDPTNPGTDPPVNPDLLEAVRRAEHSSEDPRRGGGRDHGRGGGRKGRDRRGGRFAGNAPRGGRRAGVRPPRRDVVVSRLDAAGLLPAIMFVFSRKGCDAAVDQVIASGIALTTQAERREITAVLAGFEQRIPAEDADAVGWPAFEGACLRGVAAHHAGLLPVFKEAVEALFARGLVKVVFATETLALGINMPARSVVLERLDKWDGKEHAPVTPGEYTQLTGRAGRRGIDVEGHAVVLYASGVDPKAVAGLASRRTYPLRSSFHPTYNMAVNLLSRADQEQVRDLLEQSFAQFQADRGVVHLARQSRSQAEALAGYREAMACERGDIAGYLALRERVTTLEAAEQREASREGRKAATRDIASLRPGMVVDLSGGRGSQWAVVVSMPDQGRSGPIIQVLTLERQVRTVTVADVPRGLAPHGRVKVPKDFTTRDARSRRDLASSLRNAVAAGVPSRESDVLRRGNEDLAAARAAVREHPCHGCPDRGEHLRWAVRAQGLQADHEKLLARIDARTASIARDFDKVCEVLTTLGYLRPAEESTPETRVTDSGRWLRRLYAERDLTLAECLRSGAWEGLSPAELAAALTCIVYSTRGEEDNPSAIPAGIPPRLEAALATTARIAVDIELAEKQAGLVPTSGIDTGLVRIMHTWASGASLATTLGGTDIAAGDLVRWCKQVLDVLDQVRIAAPDAALRSRAEHAVGAVRRGVVAGEVTA